MGEAKRKASLPSLRDWLAALLSEDPEARDGFAAFAEWTARMLAHSPPDDRVGAMMLVMIQAFSLAIIESGNHAQVQGNGTADVLATMCRCLGLSFGYAMMSLDCWKEDTPHHRLTRPLTEEFRAGLKFAIDEVLRTSDELEGLRA